MSAATVATVPRVLRVAGLLVAGRMPGLEAHADQEVQAEVLRALLHVEVLLGLLPAISVSAASKVHIVLPYVLVHIPCREVAVGHANAVAPRRENIDVTPGIEHSQTESRGSPSSHLLWSRDLWPIAQGWSS